MALYSEVSEAQALEWLYALPRIGTHFKAADAQIRLRLTPGIPGDTKGAPYVCLSI